MEKLESKTKAESRKLDLLIHASFFPDDVIEINPFIEQYLTNRKDCNDQLQWFEEGKKLLE